MKTLRLLSLIILAVTGLTAINLASTQEEIKVGNRKIVGGEPTDIKDYPWQVGLRVKKSKGAILCSGSIVAFWVITAAHCLYGSAKPSKVRAKAGVTKLQAEGVWTRIEKIVLHKDYNPKTGVHDIALIKLNVHSKGKLIPLARSNIKIQTGQPLEITG